MIVYITTNLINGKKYIGKDEANNPNYLGSGIQLEAAFLKYGKENFGKEILCYAKDSEDLNELEIYYIDYYNAQKSKLFYNIAPGGTGGIVWDKDKCHRCNKIFEVDIINKSIIKEFNSGKEASIFYNISYKNINGVINKSKKSVNGKVFIKSEDFDTLNWEFYQLRDKKFKYISSVTNKVFYSKRDIWEEEFNHQSWNKFVSSLNSYLKTLRIVKEITGLRIKF